MLLPKVAHSAFGGTDQGKLFPILFCTHTLNSVLIPSNHVNQVLILDNIKLVLKSGYQSISKVKSSFMWKAIYLSTVPRPCIFGALVLPTQSMVLHLSNVPFWTHCRMGLLRNHSLFPLIHTKYRNYTLCSFLLALQKY